MKLLLDTHIWIWVVDRPEKLTREVRRQIGNPRNELYLSPLSIWEAYGAHRLRRLLAPQGFGAWLDHALVVSLLREAPLNFAVAAEAAGIELPQSDLADVFLAATARVHDLTLVTADPQLIACSWLKTLPNQ